MNFFIRSAVCLPVSSESDPRPFSRSMSATGLTSQAQINYILQWFKEFSEYQREDFLPILASAHGNKPEQLAITLSNLSCQDKPVSLFQCRIKLFNEWFPSWSDEEKEKLVKQISELDPEFSEKLQEAVLKGIQVNGNEEDSIANDAHKSTEAQETEHDADQEVINQENVNTDFAANQENVSIEIIAAS